MFFYSTSHQIPKHEQKVGCPAGLVKMPAAVFLFSPILGAVQVFVCIECVVSCRCWPCYVAAANLFPQGDKKLYLSVCLSVRLSIHLPNWTSNCKQQEHLLPGDTKWILLPWNQTNHAKHSDRGYSTALQGKTPVTSYSCGCCLTHKILLQTKLTADAKQLYGI